MITRLSKSQRRLSDIREPRGSYIELHLLTRLDEIGLGLLCQKLLLCINRLQRCQHLLMLLLQAFEVSEERMPILLQGILLQLHLLQLLPGPLAL